MQGVLGTPAALAFFWLWNKVKELEKRLNEGSNRFDRMDAELKEINKSLGIIIGKVDTMLRRSGHTPNYTDCFKNCGIDTPTGRAELEQIPTSWGGLAEG